MINPNRFPSFFLFLKPLFFIAACLCAFQGFSQTPVVIDDGITQQIFEYDRIDVLEDASGRLSLEDILSPVNQKRFVSNKSKVPKNTNVEAAYWFRFRIDNRKATSREWLLEFFDQTISELTLYASQPSKGYLRRNYGAGYEFQQRSYNHKNFTYPLKDISGRVSTYYVRIKSSQKANALIVLRDFSHFVSYSTNEYLTFGLFYGMIIIFSLYNLLMFFAVKRIQYLFYVLYNLAIALYEMCSDGVAFQYLWPDVPVLNLYGFGVALYLSSLFGMLFTINFLYLKYKNQRYFKLAVIAIWVRTAFFMLCLLKPAFFGFKLFDIMPLLICLVCAIKVFRGGYKPALFLIIGYSILLGGVGIKVLLFLELLYSGPVMFYGFNISLILEMIVISFAIGSSIRVLRKKQNHAQKRIIEQLRINDKLTQTLNTGLSAMVEERTAEIRIKAEIIKNQNEKISLMNRLLKQDNVELNLKVEKHTKARINSKIPDFEEFSQIYPDKESALKYIAEIKWKAGYSCKKCSNTQHLSGQSLYSKRCTKCGYDESVIHGTVFQNGRIPINKALYMMFLVHNSKGKISSYKLSQILNIRQGTCWSYNAKMQRILQKRKDLRNNSGETWSDLIMEG